MTPYKEKINSIYRRILLQESKPNPKTSLLLKEFNSPRTRPIAKTLEPIRPESTVM